MLPVWATVPKGAGPQEGQNWKQHLYRELREADAVIGVLADYRASRKTINDPAGLTDDQTVMSTDHLHMYS